MQCAVYRQPTSIFDAAREQVALRGQNNWRRKENKRERERKKMENQVRQKRVPLSSNHRIYRSFSLMMAGGGAATILFLSLPYNERWKSLIYDQLYCRRASLNVGAKTTAAAAAAREIDTSADYYWAVRNGAVAFQCLMMFFLFFLRKALSSPLPFPISLGLWCNRSSSNVIYINTAPARFTC